MNPNDPNYNPQPYPNNQTPVPQQPTTPPLTPYPTQQPPNPYPQPIPQMPPPKSKRPLLLFVFAFVIGLGLIAAAVLYFGSKKSNDESPSNSNSTSVEAGSTAKKNVVYVSGSKDITAANVSTECFSYKVIEGTKTTVQSCGAISAYHSADRTVNGDFEVDYWSHTGDSSKQTKLTSAVEADYKNILINDDLAKSFGRTVVSEKHIKVGGLPAYQIIYKEDNDYKGTKILVETGNRFAIDNTLYPFFEISGEYDNTDGGTQTFFDNALASLKWND